MQPGHPSITSVVLTEDVVRLSWRATPTADDLRAAVSAALATSHRVEVLLEVSDEEGHRVALWAGLRREGTSRGVTQDGVRADRAVFARLKDDALPTEPGGFRSMLNSFLPRKRAIAQLLVRDPQGRVLHCQLTYKLDWDLPGGVIEVGENPRTGVLREVSEELDLDLTTSRLLLTDWMPAWGGWDDALCLVFDGGVVEPEILDRVVRQEREIRSVAFLSPDQVLERAADFTARRVAAALAALEGGPGYTESGRPFGA